MKIGIALGSGAARGWAHIGVLKELKSIGVNIDVVAGSSIGSFVGAANATGHLAELENWVTSLNWRELLSFVDINLSGGILQGDKLINFFNDLGINSDIEQLDCKFGAVATEYGTGQEVWLKKGQILDAIRASCTFPSLFNPVCHNERWLLDGGLVNPVPVSLCRALGADIVIAVDLNTQLVGRHAMFETTQQEPTSQVNDSELGKIDVFKSWLTSNKNAIKDNHPGLLDVITASINIMQDRITRSRMAGDPPDILLSPRVNDIGMFDFSQAKLAIDEGALVTRNAARRIQDLCGLSDSR
ncbi:patatin-like phospholipase RssA [Shewanella sp. 202IG2-18]|uniref:patatin-like phospholipase RssA n=1 Tax=Parashewanella hymeniacidonis TaxID=2807618 RepID=UPI0019602631|nr:patatin-like phospholipase RssA [Parashewanella hymeniacidonis]MBM7072264.1 patatin-like phospholipase RssA [Parashewanella hymeniacidonis]